MSGFASPEATPRKRRLSPFTPDSARKDSPFGSDRLVTPKEKIHRYAPKPAVPEGLAAKSPATLLPTPSTVGSGRCRPQAVAPSKRSKNLTACLQALSDEATRPASTADYSPGLQIQMPTRLEDCPSPSLARPHRRLFEEEDGTSSLEEISSHSDALSQLPSSSDEFPKYPRTPPQLTIKQESLFEDIFPSDEEVSIVSMSDVQKIPRHELSNPFLETKPAALIEGSSPPIDLSQTIELINHTTGERKLQRMSEEQKRFKPRKLVFTDGPAPLKLNFNVTNNYIGKNIGKNFTLHDSPGLAPGFEIYDDNSD